MLLAQVVGGDVNTLAIVMAGITTVGAFGTAYLAYLSNKAKLQFDGEKVALQTRVTLLESDVVECKQDRGEKEKLIVALIDLMEGHGIECPPPPSGGTK